eukprot:501799-Prymnesium_polylepis.1
MVRNPSLPWRPGPDRTPPRLGGSNRMSLRARAAGGGDDNADRLALGHLHAPEPEDQHQAGRVIEIARMLHA